MDISLQDILFSSLGGLAIFLFGIKYMSEGLQNAAGKRLRVFLEKGTKTPVRGVIIGTLVTALIQSSSGTTVLTVGLVNAGLLTLRQAIGVIMGANIGTTMTAYLIGFKLKEYALPIMVVGAILLFFFKGKKFRHVGQVIFGFGMLFYGMSVMGHGLKPLKELEFFTNLMTGVENNNLLGVAIGTVFTMVVQSSSATIGILQELANQGAVTYKQAVPILFGDNIGTTVTALLAAIGTSVAARRTAMTHMLFNLAGTAVFLPLTLLGIFPEIVRLVTDYFFVLLPGFEGTWATLNIKMQIAQTHGVFNITNTLIQLPFVGALAWIVTKLIPGEQAQFDMEPKYLEPRLLSNPPVALGQAKNEIIRMGKYASEFFDQSIEFFFNPKSKDLNPMYLEQKEELIDRLEEETTKYLVALSGENLTEENSAYLSTLLHATNDLERIGDHADNIVEMALQMVENKLSFTEEGQESIRHMAELTSETLKLALKALETNDHSLARQVIKNEAVIDNLEKEFRDGHIMRINAGVCFAAAQGAIFQDLLSNMERVGDHAVNIAEAVLGNMGSVERRQVKNANNLFSMQQMQKLKQEENAVSNLKSKDYL